MDAQVIEDPQPQRAQAAHAVLSATLHVGDEVAVRTALRDCAELEQLRIDGGVGDHSTIIDLLLEGARLALGRLEESRAADAPLAALVIQTAAVKVQAAQPGANVRRELLHLGVWPLS
jgi:hypothetical protein